MKGEKVLLDYKNFCEATTETLNSGKIVVVREAKFNGKFIKSKKKLPDIAVSKSWL